MNDSLQIGTEIETSLGMGECTASAGYQFDIPSSGFCFKGRLCFVLTLAYTWIGCKNGLGAPVLVTSQERVVKLKRIDCWP